MVLLMVPIEEPYAGLIFLFGLTPYDYIGASQNRTAALPTVIPHIICVSSGTLSPSILFLNPLHRINCLCNILQALLTLWPNLNVKVACNSCGMCRFNIKETYVKLSLE